MDIFQINFPHLNEIMDFLQHERRPYIIKERKNPFIEYDVLDFFVRFRLKKPTVLFVLEQIEHLLETPTDWNKSISPMNQLLIALRFYATGSFLQTIGDTINISKSSSSKIIKKVSQAIASLSPNYIKMPSSNEEILRMQTDFFSKARLPRIIGSLDFTHVKIQSPGGNHAETFRNRKGYFSFNVQTVASPDLKILDIVARWPGSVHDQTIFDNSSLSHRLENGNFGNSLLVADSGYRNTQHVITPLLEANNDVEQLYNESVRRTRNPVERQYGVWKRRFPVLAIGLRLKLTTSMDVVVACAVLHNIAIEHREEQPQDELEVGQGILFNENMPLEPAENNILLNARDELINNYFTRLLNRN